MGENRPHRQEDAAVSGHRQGLGHWMRRVLAEHRKAEEELAPDAVHDLRVAFRRCRSISDGLMELDADPSWRAMKKAARKLFRRLGDLRDTQVLIEWVNQLSSHENAVGQKLLFLLNERQHQQKDQAARAVERFDRVQWKAWAKHLARRADRVPPEGPAVQHIALQRWEEAHALHRRALRNRSQVAWHRLRIGVKRFRYTVENFLPQHHAEWGEALKQIQDLLGQVHDLDVLWATLPETGELFSAAERSHWRATIDQERESRLAQYKQRMTGAASLWSIWRAGLPDAESLESAAVAKLAAWAAFLDRDFAHARHAARLSLNLFDGLAAAHTPGPYADRHNRQLLFAAALMHNVGHADGRRGHHKASYKLIRKLAPPIGWSDEDLEVAALVARYHRGAWPRDQHQGFRDLPPLRREVVLHLSGILRLATAFDHLHDQRVRQLQVQTQAEAVLVWARGYAEDAPYAQILAAERHLLERALRRPVIIRAKPVGPQRVSRRAAAAAQVAD